MDKIVITYEVDIDKIKHLLHKHFLSAFERYDLIYSFDIPMYRDEYTDEFHSKYEYYFEILKNKDVVSAKIIDYIDEFFKTKWKHCRKNFTDTDDGSMGYNIWKLERICVDGLCSFYHQLTETDEDSDWFFEDFCDYYFNDLCDWITKFQRLWYNWFNSIKRDKISGWCKKQLYNPHFKIGQKFALKQIEWAFDE